MSHDPTMHASSLNNSPQSYYTGLVERLPQIAGRCSYEQDRMDVVAAATFISELQAEVNRWRLNHDDVARKKRQMEEIKNGFYQRALAAESSLSRIKSETVEAACNAIAFCPSLDSNGYICEKSAAIAAIRSLSTDDSVGSERNSTRNEGSR
ncbi:hypothetical protein [Afipia sp. DC4300-2b1]|uniref:hypothetical protein n=1 Tax=Afipia sp. DC4300-2b1 TaxID=2804672 RepID=UPI003CF0A93D